MPQQLTGTIGDFGLIGGATRFLNINLEPAKQFFREVAIRKSDIMMDNMGLYSYLPVGRDGKAQLLELTTPKHLLQSRKNCKTWSPKGSMYLRPHEVDTVPVEYMGEQCADSLIGSCLEKLLATGPDVWDLSATPESRALLAQMVQSIYLGLGNSFFDLSWFGMWPVISSADTGTWWDTGTTTDAEWADFVDQMTGINLKGFITLIEEEKTAGTTHFSVDISGNVTDDVYDGSDITADFDLVIAAATPKFRNLINRRRTDIGVVMLVHPAEFDAYKSYIKTTYNAIPEGYYMMIDGEPVRGVLMYDDIPVIRVDEWKDMDDMLGINTHRILLTSTRNLAIAYDVAGIDQFGGIGLRIEQDMRLRNKGLTDMYTTFRMGTAIADTDFMVNASVVLTP